MSLTDLNLSTTRLLPSERAAGRLMRAPDHGVPTDDVPAPVAADPAPAPADPVDPAPADPAPADPAPVVLTADEQAAKDAADKAAEGAKTEFNPHGAPEGDYELKMPEGVDVDKSMLEAFNPIAKELDLSNAGAQRVAEFYIEKVQPAIADAFIKGIEADVETHKAQLAADTKTMIAEDAKAAVAADRVFDGLTATAVSRVSARALDRFGSPELRKLLDESGHGNSPEMMKFTYKIGKLIGEDNDFPRAGHVPQPKSREEKYYGK